MDKNENELKDFYDIQWYDDNGRRRLQGANDSDTDIHNNAIFEDDEIITALCPPNYCCQSVRGCDYLQCI